MEIKSIIFLCLAGLAICYGEDLEDVAEVSSNRILDGQLASEGQFPYAVSIQLLGPQNQAQDVRGHKCGGALITHTHAATVARCMFVETNNVLQLLTASQVRIFAGSVFLTNDTSVDRIRAVASITIHPQYTGSPAFVNDIAVVTAVTAYPANAVTPLSLPSTSFNPADFTACTVTGWGGNDVFQNGSVQLRFANKYVYNQNLCMTLYNQIPMAKNILPSMVCAVSLDLLSSNCLGDEGNPLVCGGTFTGLLSQSDGCSRSSIPEIYVRVSNYTNWLRTVSGSSAIYAPGILVIIAVFSVMQTFLTT